MARQTLQKRRARIAALNKQIRSEELAIQRLIQVCRHVWKVHSHFPKLDTTGLLVEQWWSHFICTECECTESHRTETPLCPRCRTALVLYTKDSVRARRTLSGKVANSSHPVKSFVFRCKCCRTFHGFVAQLDPHRDKKSPGP